MTLWLLIDYHFPTPEPAEWYSAPPWDYHPSFTFVLYVGQYKYRHPSSRRHRSIHRRPPSIPSRYSQDANSVSRLHAPIYQCRNKSSQQARAISWPLSRRGQRHNSDVTIIRSILHYIRADQVTPYPHQPPLLHPMASYLSPSFMPRPLQPPNWSPAPFSPQPR